MRTALTIFVCSIIAIVVAVVVLNSRDSNVVVLPNGLQVEFLDTRVGGATFSTERRWHKLARRFLPFRWQRWIPAKNSGSCSGGTNGITVYLRITDPSGARINQTPWQRYSAQSDDGYAHESEGGYCSFGGNSNSVLYGLSLRSHPRRQETFKFNFLGQSNSILASIRIPNPVKGPFPEWIPLPLPQSHSNGSMKLTLESLRV
ncbi:MAG TPA: hypothetical protein VK530_15390, partial [Candidatus Acidoferrum sp.]|nr:hypothetical protein [Candidatus Acidoferrum sp.]